MFLSRGSAQGSCLQQNRWRMLHTAHKPAEITQGFSSTKENCFKNHNSVPGKARSRRQEAQKYTQHNTKTEWKLREKTAASGVLPRVN